ncbi:hypothetical protein VNO77_11145 [Canavalia gladiata]|uniref:Uncharacterized protein n=1 Tax=Canavalia gladiata TaxID=3824 RepID=A0AAN9MGJ4_CANGL
MSVSFEVHFCENATVLCLNLETINRWRWERRLGIRMRENEVREKVKRTKGYGSGNVKGERNDENRALDLPHGNQIPMMSTLAVFDAMRGTNHELREIMEDANVKRKQK